MNIRYLFFGCLCACLFACCKGKERVSTSSVLVKRDSVWVSMVDTFVREVEVLRGDTLVLRDSVEVREFVSVVVNDAGDTIWHDRVVYRDRWHDGAERSVRSERSAMEERSAASANSELSEVLENSESVKKSTKEGVFTWWRILRAVLVAGALLGAACGGAWLAKRFL